MLKYLLLTCMFLYQVVALPCTPGHIMLDGLCQKCPENTFVQNVFLPCAKCPQDYVSQAGSHEVSNCVPRCPANSYGFGGEDCTRCPSYSVSLKGSQTFEDCHCKAGYSGMPGFCTPCPQGTYKPGNGPDACTPCPEFDLTTLTIASVDIDNCVCIQGFHPTSNSHTCEACTVGKYKDSISSDPCQLCPEGSTTETEASIHDVQCLPDVGYYIDQDLSKCPAGFYKDTVGDYACIPCAIGATSLPGSSKLSDCICSMPGYKPSQKKGSCACLDGYFTNPANDEECIECPPGSYCRDAKKYDCPIHTESVSKSTDVSSCRCSHGFEMSSNGVCIQCNVGKFYNVESKMCENCPLHSTSPASSISIGDCQCNAGYSMAANNHCIECQSGTYKNTLGNFDCNACPQFTSSNLDKTDCVCADGSYNPSGHECVQCPSGFYCSMAQATPCPENSNSLPGSTTLDDCKCNMGYTITHQSKSCVACPANTFKNTSGPDKCIICNDNAQSAMASISAKDCKCNAGYTGSQNCVTCAQGKYKAISGSESCQICEINSFSDAGAVSCSCNAGYALSAGGCQACEQGKYKVSYVNEPCQACPDNSISLLDASIAKDDCLCNAGYTLNVEGECVACIGGKYKHDIGFHACHDCKINSHSSRASTKIEQCHCNTGYYLHNDGTCQVCGANFYTRFVSPQDTVETICTSCGTNAISPIRSSHIANCSCDIGHEFVGFSTDKNHIICRKCDSNKFTLNQKCVSCPANSVLTGLHASDCVCDAGHTKINGQCVPCAAGFFKPQVGNFACDLCPSHSTTLSNTTDCQCEAGFQLVDKACVPCPIGTYKSFVGNTICEACPKNSTSLTTGANSEMDCKCDKGFKGPGGFSCGLVCPPGYTNDKNNVHCVACAPGKYKIDFSNDACTNCYANSFHYETGATSVETCKCMHGHYKTNEHVCSQCPVGKFNNYFDEGFCHNCKILIGDQCLLRPSHDPFKCENPCEVTAGYEKTLNGLFRPCHANQYNDGVFRGIHPTSRRLLGHDDGDDERNCLDLPWNGRDFALEYVGDYCIGIAATKYAAGSTVTAIGSNWEAYYTLENLEQYNNPPLYNVVGGGYPGYMLPFDENEKTIDSYIDEIVAVDDYLIETFGDENARMIRFEHDYLERDVQRSGSIHMYRDFNYVYPSDVTTDQQARELIIAMQGQTPTGLQVGPCVSDGLSDEWIYLLKNADEANIPYADIWDNSHGTGATYSYEYYYYYSTFYGYDSNNRLDYYKLHRDHTCATAPLTWNAGSDGGADCTECVTCPVGSSTPDSGSTSILDCICHIGYTRVASNGTEFERCFPCEMGYYKDTTGSAACLSCNANHEADQDPNAVRKGTLTRGTTVESDCVCMPGFQNSLDNCYPCPPNTYSSDLGFIGGGKTCTACPANSLTPTVMDTFQNVLIAVGYGAATSVDVCLCEAGYTNTSAGGCEFCPSNTFKSDMGNYNCQDCPVNSVSSVDRTECLCNSGLSFYGGNCHEACSAGRFFDVETSSCESCARGFYSADANFDYQCTSCPTVKSSTLFAQSTSSTDCVCPPTAAALKNFVTLTQIDYFYNQLYDFDDPNFIHNVTFDMNDHIIDDFVSLRGVLSYMGQELEIFDFDKAQQMPQAILLENVYGYINIIYCSHSSNCQPNPDFAKVYIQTHQKIALSNEHVMITETIEDYNLGDYVFTDANIYSSDSCTACPKGIVCK